MGALLVSSLVSFFSDKQKSLARGENHSKCNHTESFTHVDGIIRGEVHIACTDEGKSVASDGKFS